MIQRVYRHFFLAALAKVARCRHHHPGIDAQIARAQHGVRHRPHANGQVNTLLYKIDKAVVKAQVQLHLRMPGHEIQGQRHDDATAEGH